MCRRLCLVVLVGMIVLAGCNAPSTLQVTSLAQGTPLLSTPVRITPVQTVPVPSVTRVPLPTTASTASASPSQDIATSTSQALGISFNYLPAQGVKVQEIGDKVYVYAGNMLPTEGQWVQVFKKARADSLEEAIRKQFLKGYSAQDCLIVKAQDPVRGHTYPDSYAFAQIDVPRSANDDVQAILTKAAKCPSPYTTTNGVAYFLSDTQHPDKFVFFNIGQYPIQGDHTRLWQATIRFTGEPNATIEQTPMSWVMYTNTRYGFSLQHPADWEMSEIIELSGTVSGFIGRQVFWGIGKHNPRECAGDCPAVDQVAQVDIGRQRATRVMGHYLGPIADMGWQHYLSYIFRKGELFYMFTLCAVDAKGVPQSMMAEEFPLRPTDVTLFEQMMATLEFNTSH